MAPRHSVPHLYTKCDDCCTYHALHRNTVCSSYHCGPRYLRSPRVFYAHRGFANSIELTLIYRMRKGERVQRTSAVKALVALSNIYRETYIFDNVNGINWY
jgi:hypothetical protein